MEYTEQDLQEALAKYRRGGHSIRSISREFGIPRSTLRHRLDGRQSRSAAAERYQILGREEEELLARLIVVQTNLGVPPTHAEIMEIAGRILKARGAGRTTVGKNWLERFLRRNPQIRAQRTCVNNSNNNINKNKADSVAAAERPENQSSESTDESIINVNNNSPAAGREEEEEKDNNNDTSTRRTRMRSLARSNESTWSRSKSAVQGPPADEESGSESGDSVASCIVVS